MPRSAKPSGRRLGHRAAPKGPIATPVRPRPEVRIIDTAEVLGEPDRALIAREARKLSAFFDRILEIRVTVTAPHRRLHREVIAFQVRIHVKVPLDELMVRQRTDETLVTAVQEAFRAARRMVQDYVGRLRETRSRDFVEA
ncbi:MAG: HPF/RaiA family ribosome-associated protein [Gemmatimonadales bacterium]|nr:HPF/RaiA family ribosome-associated protein [Gemmatimonadales bacterium]